MDGISVVIPAYNEEKRIKDTIKRIQAHLEMKKKPYEIIVVDDGSSDNTCDVIRKLADDKIYLLSYGENKGKGFAVKVGMLSAKMSLCLFSDADLSTPIEELDKFLTQKADIIIGSRNLAESKITLAQPLIRQKLGKAFPWIVERIAPLGIKDTQCGFKLFTRDCAHAIFKRVKTNRFGFDVEALYIARKLGYTIIEMPVEWKNSGGSKVNIIIDAPRMLLDTIMIRWRDQFGEYR